MRWRNPNEIAFRLRQEAGNLRLLLKPPRLRTGIETRMPGLPDPDAATRALQNTRSAGQIVAIAEQILAHRFPLLGVEIDTGTQIHWRRDYERAVETPAIYFRRIPYLNTARVGDHKIIWELNRHQHLVLLAQAHLLTGRPEFLDEISKQLDSWLHANPFQRGINWTSALEVAFRSLSWIWVLHLAGDRLDSAFRDRLGNELYHHGLYLACNLSVHFSPNTHLLGEAVALHALGLFFRGLQGTDQWQRRGAEIVAEQMECQVHADGSHFEQSSNYHLYALDMFLFHALLAPPPQDHSRKLILMAEYLAALMGPARSLPFIGDDDGGRFFHPFGARDRFGRATLATCGALLARPEWIADQEDLREQAAWWLGPQEVGGSVTRMPPSSSWFPNSGVAVMVSGAAYCCVDAGPFGPFRGGHSHADTLSIVARSGDQDLLIDPGTFTYADDSKWRNVFRGTAAHNTVRLQGRDQADPAGAFGWLNPPSVKVHCWHSDTLQEPSRTTEPGATEVGRVRDCTEGRADPVRASMDFLDAECLSRGLRHRRRVVFLKPDLLFVLDDIEGEDVEGEETGLIQAEQFWHAGGPVITQAPGCFRIAAAGTLVLDIKGAVCELSEGGEFGWRSPVLALKESAPVIMSRREGKQAVRFGAVLAFSAPAGYAELAVAAAGEDVQMALTGAWKVSLIFPDSGLPRRVI